MPLLSRPTRWPLVVSEPDRRALERAGWRTTLDYRENLRRDGEGVLIGVERCWLAEAEHPEGRVLAVSVRGSTSAGAWSRLRMLAMM